MQLSKRWATRPTVRKTNSLHDARNNRYGPSKENELPALPNDKVPPLFPQAHPDEKQCSTTHTDRHATYSVPIHDERFHSFQKTFIIRTFLYQIQKRIDNHLENILNDKIIVWKLEDLLLQMIMLG